MLLLSFVFPSPFVCMLWCPCLCYCYSFSYMMAPDRNGNSTEQKPVQLFKPSGMGEAEDRLRVQINTNRGENILPNYQSLHEYSIKHCEEFWEEMMEYAKIKLSTTYEGKVLSSPNIADFPMWFKGAMLNYTENCLNKGRPQDPAFITAYSATETEVITFERLRQDVENLGRDLRNMGVKPSDAVCGFMPNSYYTAVAMFATAAVGAVWSSASVDFGPRGVLDRFQQVKPKVLVTVYAVTYKGKRWNMHEKINEIVDGLPELEHILVFSHLKEKDESMKREGEFSERVQGMMRKMTTKTEKEEHPPFEYEQVPFAHPLFIMFSSGTTGIPKAIVHSQGGTLLKHVEEHLIQENAVPSDRMLFYTTCGWMMWNWLMTFTYVGASIVVFDESPLEPDPHILLKIAANTECTMIGAGAKLYDEYHKMDVDFNSLYNLKKIRMILSTGSPLKASSFEFIGRNIAPGAVIGSISGGTDIIGCFMGASLSLPVYAGECQCLYLGMDMHAYDEDGKPVLGEQGELVCTTPFPSMPTHFLNDAKHTKYKAAYFDRFPDVWAHGDFCIISKETGGVVMLGRSDATLNRGGVRIGTADIYAVVERFEEINDCIVAGQTIPKEDDESILLFVKMNEGKTLDDTLKKKINTLIRTMMSPRHIPNAIHEVDDIPYTSSGKKVEMAVKKIINGDQVRNLSSLRNPDSLDCYKQFALAS